MPGDGEPPGQIVGVAQAIGEVLHAERAVQVGGVPGEEAAAAAEPGGEALLGGVVGGGEQVVAGSSPHQPVRVDFTRVSRVSPVTMPGQVACGSTGSVGAGRPGGSRQSSRHRPSGSGRAEASRSPRHGGSRCSRASPGNGRSTRTVAMACRSTAGRPGKRIFSSLRTVDRAPSQPTRWLARHQVSVPSCGCRLRTLTPSRS